MKGTERTQDSGGGGGHTVARAKMRRSLSAESPNSASPVRIHRNRGLSPPLGAQDSYPGPVHQLRKPLSLVPKWGWLGAWRLPPTLLSSPWPDLPLERGCHPLAPVHPPASSIR